MTKDSIRFEFICLVGMLCIAAYAVPVQAQFDSLTREVTKRGTTAAEFLTIPVGARATAMGGAITASVDDATAIYWNPAGMATMRNGAVTFEYADWFGGVGLQFCVWLRYRLITDRSGWH